MALAGIGGCLGEEVIKMTNKMIKSLVLGANLS